MPISVHQFVLSAFSSTGSSLGLQVLGCLVLYRSWAGTDGWQKHLWFGLTPRHIVPMAITFTVAVYSNPAAISATGQRSGDYALPQLRFILTCISFWF